MLVQLSKWGNSLGLRLPKSLAQQIGVTAGQMVSVTAEGDRLIVRAASPRWALEDLLVNMTPDAMSEAFDWGDDLGLENVDG
jgi:antitoxin MazE